MEQYCGSLSCIPHKLAKTLSQKTDSLSSLQPKRVWSECVCVLDLLGGCKQVAAVCSDAVYGALMTLELPQRPQCVCVPELEHPSSAATQQGREAGDDAEGANPVTMSIWDLL